MTAIWRAAVAILFLAGIILVGMVGTTASMSAIWPAYGLVGLAGALSIGLIFRSPGFALPRGAVLAVVALSAYVLARGATSPVAYFAREDRAVLAAAFLAYGLFLVAFDSASWRNRLFDAIALLAALHLATVLARGIWPEARLFFSEGDEPTARAAGLFADPDHLAGFLALLTPLWLAGALVGRRSRAVRGALAALSGLSAAFVCLSASAPALVALIGGVGVLGVLTLSLARPRLDAAAQAPVRRLAPFAGAILALLLVALAPTLPGWIRHSLLGKGGELALPEVWRAGGEQFLVSPVFGTGSRTSIVEGRLFRSAQLDPGPVEPGFLHNEFLQMAADYGLVGLGLALLVLVLHFAGGLRFVRSYASFPARPGERLPKSDHLAQVLGALGALVALAGFGSFEFALHLPVFAVVAALLLAVLAVPDPMARVLQPPRDPLVPGGAWHFSQRLLLFGAGLATALVAVVHTQSEYHGERARRLLATEPAGFQLHRHLRAALALDPQNPWLALLAAEAQLAGLHPDLPEPARRQALEQADRHFAEARRLDPRDVFAAIRHARVLDLLDRPEEALARLEEARRFAPHYGNVALAQGELHLRHGRIDEAERAFAEAARAHAFRDPRAAERGLAEAAEWRRLARAEGRNEAPFARGIDSGEKIPESTERDRSRRPAPAVVEQREVAGPSPQGAVSPENAPESPDR